LGSQCPICNPFAIFQAVESLYSRPSKKEGAGKGQRCGFLLEDGHSLIMQLQHPPFDERSLLQFPPEAINTKTIIFCERVFEALNLCCGPRTFFGKSLWREDLLTKSSVLWSSTFFSLVIYVLISLKSQYQIQLICDLNPLAFL